MEAVAERNRCLSLSSIVTERQYRVLEMLYGVGRWTTREVARTLRIDEKTVDREVAQSLEAVRAAGGVIIDDDFGIF